MEPTVKQSWSKSGRLPDSKVDGLPTLCGHDCSSADCTPHDCMTADRIRNLSHCAGFATRGVLDGEERLVLLAVGPGSATKLTSVLSKLVNRLC